MFFLQCAKEHLQFCADATLTVLKKWRFCLESSKIQGVEDEADRATSGLVRTCHVIAQLFASHAQMFMVWLLNYLSALHAVNMHIVIELFQHMSVSSVQCKLAIKCCHCYNWPLIDHGKLLALLVLCMSTLWYMPQSAGALKAQVRSCGTALSHSVLVYTLQSLTLQGCILDCRCKLNNIHADKT